ncbi:retrovirus-related pol polyprotein from type-1 retrotransposable element r1 [Plakobranchus ocellatus]|uniref:Retrovirus-related pol polyprotein from type-1 retrotransposable element r1 n=1 Tax=Plakobranchus ocellatus TaxID=259542 RepID=A0AAV3YIF6_9GAST|nr:retrovirus-related pol polyprotein from type-1 retrotransposable element r1 [Plakobranchus ocellatus]
MNQKKKSSDPSPQPDVAKKPCTEAARGAASVASKRKAEDLPTLMSVSPFAGWSPFKKFIVISSKGSAKVADRSPFKIHRELKSILGDETIEVTKLGSGDLMVELKSNDQAKKLGAIATFLDIPVTPIPVKGEAKFLGFFFDSKLNFSSHVKYLKKKCLKALNLLRVVGHTDWGADRATLLRLYCTLVRSKLDYGSVIYGSPNKHVLRALDPIHHQGLRIALGAFRTTPIKSLYAEAGEPSLEHRRMKLTFNYVLKLKSLPHRSKATRLRDGASVFSAELEAIALALTEIKKLTIYHKNFVIYSDSLSALQAIQSKNFKVIDIRRLYNLIRKFPSYVQISFVWIPAHVDIQGNENVDKLAKAALNRTSTSGKLICYSDLKPQINTYIKSVWQRDWDAEGAHKLHEVLPNLDEDLHRRGEGAGRKRKTAMCRLRVWAFDFTFLSTSSKILAFPKKNISLFLIPCWMNTG